LTRHQQAQHPEQAGFAAPARARGFAASVNGRFPDNWQRYAPHRHRLMQLVEQAGTTRRAGVLVCDVATTQRLPELDRFQKRSGAELAAFVAEQAERGALSLNPGPRGLLAWLEAPGLRGLVRSPRVLEPWLWDLGEVRQLVYALTFRHPAA
jgi:hypothetical protein